MINQVKERKHDHSDKAASCSFPKQRVFLLSLLFVVCIMGNADVCNGQFVYPPADYTDGFQAPIQGNIGAMGFGDSFYYNAGNQLPSFFSPDYSAGMFTGTPQQFGSLLRYQRATRLFRKLTELI